jgi:hypothetical protein
MATKKQATFQSKTTNSLGSNSVSNSTGNMGNNNSDGSSDTAYISFLVLLTLLFFIILPFELYLYIIVRDAVAACNK